MTTSDPKARNISWTLDGGELSPIAKAVWSSGEWLSRAQVEAIAAEVERQVREAIDALSFEADDVGNMEVIDTKLFRDWLAAEMLLAGGET